MVVIVVQVSVLGLYRAPVLRYGPPVVPPHTIISLPVHTALCLDREVGAKLSDVGTQVSDVGL